MDIVRTYSAQDGARLIRIARTTDLVKEAGQRHKLTPFAEAALGRALTCAALVPMTWKDADRVTLQWAGDGIIGTVVAEARSDGSVRGYVTEPAAVLPSWRRGSREVGLGNRGHLSIVRQAVNGAYTQGQVALTGCGIDDDLEGWYRHSAQIPLRLRVDDGDDATVGILVQSMPKSGESRADRGLANLRSVEVDLRLHDDETILAAFSFTDAVRKSEAELSFRCPCSYERCRAGIAMFGEQDLLAMVAEDHGAEIRCEFCAENYEFGADVLCEIIDEKRSHNPDK